MATTRSKPVGALHILTPRQVLAADADLPDGGGLALRVGQSGAAWVLRYTAPSGKRREIGLGVANRSSLPQAGASLTAARDAAHRARELLRVGVDPLDDRERRRQEAQQHEDARKTTAAADRRTLARAAREYHERAVEPRLSSKHAAQWISSLENHVPAELWHAPIASIEAPALLAALAKVKPHERARNLKGDRVPETLRRLRQRLDTIFEDAIFHGHCAKNPAAAIRRKMAETLPAKQGGQFAALPYREAPALLHRLRAAPGTAARCLEFAVLTAARTGEVLGATWSEIDLEAATWLVPAARMKSSGKLKAEEHLVHLSERAVEILRGQVGQHERIVFPSPMDTDRPQSNMAMLTLLGRLGVRDRTTVHGLCRATFSTWAYETAAARPDVIEACLAHREADKVKAAYNRAEFTDERRALLKAWAAYLTATARVIPMRAA
ncbi:MAG: tyrosine-type recombinase/integrase [Burkholderiales bacterium]|nr:tyrosine-type recombinase/integrase [Burkholderiales bacterium]